MPDTDTDHEAQDPAPRPRSRWRWLGWAALALVVLLLAGVATAWVLAGRIDWAGVAASRLTAALGRPVHVGALRLVPGRIVGFELRDLAIDNVAGGTRPSMLEIAGVSGEVDPLSILRGPLRLPKLRVDGMDLLLERGEGGRPNWRFHGDAPPPPDPAGDRAGTPVMLDARVVGTITVHTRRGRTLTTNLDGIAIRADGTDTPVTMAGPGSYQGVPVTLDGTLGSYAQLYRTADPFPAKLRFTSGATVLSFDGTMTDPMNVNGADGAMTLEAPSLLPIYGMVRVDSTVDPGLTLAGRLTRSGRDWVLDAISGALASGTIGGGRLTLTEGVDGGPDAFGVTLDLDQLDLNAILGQGETGGGNADVSLSVEANPSTLLTLAISAKETFYGALRLTDTRIAAKQQPGVVAIDSLAVTYLGGQLHARGSIVPSERRPADGKLNAELDAAGLDIPSLRTALEIGSLPLSGRVDARMALTAEGPTLNAAARTGHLSAVAAMRGGAISREVVELASTNPLALLRNARGMSPIACAIAVLDVRGGAGTLAPLRIRASDGTIVGRGTFDLFRRRVDLVVATESRTTSSLALDVPMRISGSLSSPSIAPARLSGGSRGALAVGDDPARLLPVLQEFARARACR